MSEQSWRVPLSPAQRLQLWTLANTKRRGEEVIKDGQAGRRVRRFMRAFGLMPIDAAIRDNSGSVRTSLASDTKTRALFEVTAENLEECLRLQRVQRETAAEVLLGDLWDLLEDCKSGKPYATPAVALYDAATEDWAPPQKPVALADAIDTLDDVLEHKAALPAELVTTIADLIRRYDESEKARAQADEAREAAE